MRKTIIAGNWKMNKTIAESLSLVKELKKIAADVKDREIVVCPAFTALGAVAAELKSSNIKVGAQNMHFEKNGAFTGEVSALMLRDISVEYVILGHSERRHIFGEKDEVINQKVKAALLNGLKPIFCVGETLSEREAGKTNDIIGNQILKGLKDASKKDIKNVVIAYEPVWAIGTGKNATPEQAEEAHVFIRKVLSKVFDNKIANEVSILYGGSVKPDNIKGIIAKENIDGVLVGGASLDAKSFYQIIKC